MTDLYVYPGTNTLKNRFGISDASVANWLEAMKVAEARDKPVSGFTADLAGLKAAHKVLFQDMWEWAGHTRNERVTIDGTSFKPPDHILTKGATQFGPASLSEWGLPRTCCSRK